MNYTDRMKWSEGMFLAAFALGINGSGLLAMGVAAVGLILNIVWHSPRTVLRTFRTAVGLSVMESLLLYALQERSLFLYVFLFMHTVSVLLWKTSSQREVLPVVCQELSGLMILILTMFFLPNDILAAANGRLYLIGILALPAMPLFYLLFSAKTARRRPIRLWMPYNKRME
ncbi:MAG: hypothetical protein ACTTKS_01365 [Bulleidia sp.]